MLAQHLDFSFFNASITGKENKTMREKAREREREFQNKAHYKEEIFTEGNLNNRWLLAQLSTNNYMQGECRPQELALVR